MTLAEVLRSDPIRAAAWSSSGGVERVVEIAMDAEEQAMFDHSIAAVRALNEIVERVE